MKELIGKEQMISLDQLCVFLKILRTVIIYQNQVFEFFSEEMWL
jgi:hypothetical protein